MRRIADADAARPCVITEAPGANVDAHALVVIDNRVSPDKPRKMKGVANRLPCFSDRVANCVKGAIHIALPNFQWKRSQATGIRALINGGIRATLESMSAPWHLRLKA